MNRTNEETPRVQHGELAVWAPVLVSVQSFDLKSSPKTETLEGGGVHVFQRLPFLTFAVPNRQSILSHKTLHVTSCDWATWWLETSGFCSATWRIVKKWYSSFGRCVNPTSVLVTNSHVRNLTLVWFSNQFGPQKIIHGVI